MVGIIRSAVIILVLLGVGILETGCSLGGKGVDLGSDRWSWLGQNGGTYWYVPTETLPAIRWDPEIPQDNVTIDDQTVWHIQRYENGYFFGPAVVKFEGFPALCQYLIGSVTPKGEVNIAFNAVQTIPIGDPTITTGLGRMVVQDLQWAFVMQMNSGARSVQVAHWSYMLQCTPDQACWTDLPGVKQSLPELLAKCE